MTAAGVTATATAVSAAKPATAGRTRQPQLHWRAVVVGTSLKDARPHVMAKAAAAGAAAPLRGAASRNRFASSPGRQRQGR